MGEAFFGYLLPWGQMSYWGAQVIVNLFSTVPFIGEGLGTWIRGDYTISDITLNRFFAFHVVALPLVLLGLVAAHLMALHEVGSNNPDGIEIKQQPKDPGDRPAPRRHLQPSVLHDQGHRRRRRLPGRVLRDHVLHAGDGRLLPRANNFIPADPLKTPEHIAPVWYFTPYYAILRAIPSYLRLAVLGACSRWALSVVVFFFLPWLDRGAVKSIRYRGTLYKSWLAAFVISFLILGYLGVVPVTVWGQFPDSWPLLGGADKATVAGARPDRRLLPVLPADAVVHRARQDEAGPGKGDGRTMRTIATFAAVAVDGRLRRRARRGRRPTCAWTPRRSTGWMPSRCSAARATSSTIASTATARSTCATSG